jgi:hypothetical protein
MHLSLKEVTMHPSHEVLMEVDDNSALIVCDTKGILGQQLLSYSIQLLNIIFSLSITYWVIKLYIIK